MIALLFEGCEVPPNATTSADVSDWTTSAESSGLDIGGSLKSNSHDRMIRIIRRIRAHKKSNMFSNELLSLEVCPMSIRAYNITCYPITHHPLEFPCRDGGPPVT